MDWQSIKKIIAGEPAFRYRQIERAVFKEVIGIWSEASNLPKDLRERLQAAAPLDLPAEFSGDLERGSLKALMTLADGFKVETVLMKLGQRYTVCVSSQVGCPLACRFCATGQNGFKRNLSEAEIINQAILWARYLKARGAAIDNLVFMGMGEPFLNYENVLAAIKFLNSQDSLNIGARKISISTVGIIEGIKRLAKESLQLNLAISLHAPNDKLRSSLIPSNRKYPIKKILAAVDDYIETTGRKVMFEYILIKGVNDSEVEARALAGLMHRPLYMVNLIAYNPTATFQAPSVQAVDKFKDILIAQKINVTVRRSFGQEIAAACGQLAGQKNDAALI